MGTCVSEPQTIVTASTLLTSSYRAVSSIIILFGQPLLYTSHHLKYQTTEPNMSAYLFSEGVQSPPAAEEPP